MRVQWISAVVVVCAAALLTTASSGCKKSATVEGPGNKSLTVSVPETVTVVAGETEKMKIAVDRKNFDGPVDVLIADLPAGVTLKDAKFQLAKGENDIEVVLMADGKANALKNHAAKVTASSGEISVTETVKVSVAEKE